MWLSFIVQRLTNKHWNNNGSGCRTVGRVVAFDTRGPRFESSHFLYCQLYCTDENKEKCPLLQKHWNSKGRGCGLVAFDTRVSRFESSHFLYCQLHWDDENKEKADANGTIGKMTQSFNFWAESVLCMCINLMDFQSLLRGGIHCANPCVCFSIIGRFMWKRSRCHKQILE